MKRLAVLAALFASSTAFAEKTVATPEPKGPPSEAVTPAIVDAIAEEMNRDAQRLVIPGAPPPYSISYKITEVEVNEVVASLGQTIQKEPRHFVNIEAHVRVGSPDLDNGNFVVPDASEIDGTASFQLPLEATPRIAKRATWLVTDSAYKEALIQLRARLEARKAGGTTVARDVPAWTPAKSLVSDEPVLVAPLESLDELEARAKAVSAVFRDQPGLRDSHVALTSYLERRWYLNTEGTSVTDTRRASGLVIVADGQATDGQLVHDYFMRYGRTAKDLPSDDELKAESKRLGGSVIALEKAPVLDHYSGPVLFEGEGAVGIVRATLVPNLGGTPLPEGLNPQEAKQFGGELNDSVGDVALSRDLSLIDDPTTSSTGPNGTGKSLIGGYKVDDEGVAAQKVDVVKDGWLKSLLTSRTPSRKGQVSNGHARRTAEGGAFQGSATNLFVIGKGGVPRKALEQRLVAVARSVGKSYGLVIRRFDDAAVTASPDFTRRELFQMIKTTNQDLPPPATLAYKVFADGHQELVRGVQLREVPIKAWKDVIGVGNDPIVYNFLQDPLTQLTLKIQGVQEGFVPSSGIESSIITPDLLFKDLDVFGSTVGERVLPPVPQPPVK
ncbi:MAG TPA: metallopeptidase TldD-related protein [Kofleriaceae bacterium]